MIRRYIPSICLNAFSRKRSKAEDLLSKGDRDLREGCPNDALLYYERYLKNMPRDGAAWRRRGNVLGIMGIYPEAVKSFEKAIAIDPRDVDAWMHKGFNLFRLNRLEEALTCFSRAALNGDDDHYTWYWRALTLEALGRPESEAAFERAADNCGKSSKPV